MNNRGEGEMDENEAAFLSFSSPTFTAPRLPFSCAPLFFFSFLTRGPKKDFINN